MEPGLVLRGVVVLVDAERLPALAADPRLGDTIARQIRAADILVLNKRDLVDAFGLAASRATLAALAPGVPMVETVAAALPEALFDLGGEAPEPGPAGILPAACRARSRTRTRSSACSTGARARSTALVSGTRSPACRPRSCG